MHSVSWPSHPLLRTSYQCLVVPPFNLLCPQTDVGYDHLLAISPGRLLELSLGAQQAAARRRLLIQGQGRERGQGRGQVRELGHMWAQERVLELERTSSEADEHDSDLRLDWWGTGSRGNWLSEELAEWSPHPKGRRLLQDSVAGNVSSLLSAHSSEAALSVGQGPIGGRSRTGGQGLAGGRPIGGAGSKPGDAVPKEQRGCRLSRGDWCGQFEAQSPFPFKTAPRGSKTCPNDCNKVGNCNHDTGMCDCPAGVEENFVMGMKGRGMVE